MDPGVRSTLDALAIVAIILIITFHGYFVFFWFATSLVNCLAFVLAAGFAALELAPWLEEDG